MAADVVSGTNFVDPHDAIMKIGRNDPCPCGSGRKYKNCCLEDQGSGLPPEGPAGVFAEIRQALQGRQFSSLEELRSFTDRFMRQRNQASLDDFHALSPERIHRILVFPFDSPELVTYTPLVANDGLYRVRNRPLLADAVRFHIPM
jgi:hypothetical protein